MYVVVKGGECVIDVVYDWLGCVYCGVFDQFVLDIVQICDQMVLVVVWVMVEGLFYDFDLVVLVIKQVCGDLIEVIFLICVYCIMLFWLGVLDLVQIGVMWVKCWILGMFKDIFGGQVLGLIFDYIYWLLDFWLMVDGELFEISLVVVDCQLLFVLYVLDFLNCDGLIEDVVDDGNVLGDLMCELMELFVVCVLWLQVLVCGDEGFLLGFVYFMQCGYVCNYVFVGELCIGYVDVEMQVFELGFLIQFGEIELIECEMVNQFKGLCMELVQFICGYGLIFGQIECKVLFMVLVDCVLCWQELGEDDQGVLVQDVEFVLLYCDNIQVIGFLEYIKLLYYVDFQVELELVWCLCVDIFYVGVFDVGKEDVV